MDLVATVATVVAADTIMVVGGTIIIPVSDLTLLQYFCSLLYLIFAYLHQAISVLLHLVMGHTATGPDQHAASAISCKK